ncbi:MAG: flotillin family protein, partial [Defluviitaleaceae bacterium]|nr:flotillin family protein [Defluviitaleaceae bacterium]
VETEFKKVGLKLVNVNVTDITDKSGYIEAIGKEAAAAALNDAKKAVAEKNRDGDIGQSAASNEAKKAVAERDRDGSIGQAEAQRDQRIRLAAADADAVSGENTAKVQVANSNSALRVQAAEAQRKATAAEKVAEANALQESYAAQQSAEQARADREFATQQADVVVKARINKEQVEIAAEASAEQARRIAKGEADATYAKMEAQARGIFEILSRQANGMKMVVDAASGDADKAVQLLLVDKLPDMVKTQVEAIKGLNFGNITVWDSGAGSNGNGSSLANFASSLMGVMPPLATACKNAGFKIPGYLGSLLDDQTAAAVAENAEAAQAEGNK